MAGSVPKTRPDGPPYRATRAPFHLRFPILVIVGMDRERRNPRKLNDVQFKWFLH